MAKTLVNASQLAPFSGSTATTAKFAEGVYTGGLSMESGSITKAGGISFYNGGAIDYIGSKINLFQNTNIDGTLTVNTSLTLDTTTITTAEIGVLDSVTAGTAAASKAVVLDASKNIATIGTVGCGAITSTGASTFGSINVGGTITGDTSLTLDAVTISTAELGVLDSVSAGTAAASKAVVLDGSKNIATIGTVGCGAITSTGNSAMAQLTTSGRVIVDDATDATSTTDGSLQTDGGLSVAKDGIFGNDVKLKSDAAVLAFGDGSDVTLTHVADTALLLNSSRQLQFGDSATYIHQISDGNLKLAADTTLVAVAPTVAVTADTFQIDSANTLDPMLQLKNTTNDTNGARLHFLKDKGAAAADNDIVGMIAWSGDNDAQEQTSYAELFVQIADASNGFEGGKMVLRVASHDGEMNNGIIIADGDLEDEIDITLGNGAASRVIIPGNLIVTGTTTTVDVEVVNTANGVIFEGATDDAYETTLKAVDPTGADKVHQLANVSGFLQPFAAASTVAITSTPAELNLLDGAGASVTAAKLTTLTALTDAEIGYVDGAAAGTAAASKAVVLDSNADTAGMRNLTLSGDITIDDGGSLKEAGGTAAFTFDGSGHITKIGQSTATTNFALIWDGSKAVWSEAGVSGSVAHYSSAGLRTSGYLNVSGSSIIGDAAGDTHQITGSLEVSNIANFTSAVNAEADLTCGGLFKMADNTSTKFLVADGTSYQEVAMSGHATMANNGAVTLAADAVEGSHIALFDDSLAATTTHFLIADGTDYSSFALSGDVTCTNAGVVTIGAGAVENSMLADDAVGADELAANAVVNASVASAAGIAYSKMEAVTAGQIMVGNGSNVGTLVAVSGDATMSNAGAITIAATAVEGTMLNSNCGGNGIAVVSNALVVDFGMERCIGSSGNGYTTASGVYTLPATPVSGSEMVFLNGQMLYRGDTTDAAAGSGDYSTATGSIELHADLKLDADDVLQVYFLL
mgnify:FL=1|jgi:hypothetical protein